MGKLAELLPEMFARSRQLVLHPASIDSASNEDESIVAYFRAMESKGLNPRLPEYRQAFNNRTLDKSGSRYLVSAYGENRALTLKGSSIAQDGRTIHLGIDIFSKDLEPVLSPCNGSIVCVGREEEAHSFGNYIILKPDDESLPLLFFGHLAFDLPKAGHVKTGQLIGTLGDYVDNENGGWSRHLHFQCLRDLPAEDDILVGYSSVEDFTALRERYPDPTKLFGNWNIA